MDCLTAGREGEVNAVTGFLLTNAPAGRERKVKMTKGQINEDLDL